MIRFSTSAIACAFFVSILATGCVHESTGPSKVEHTEKTFQSETKDNGLGTESKQVQIEHHESHEETVK